jgi:tetratricopeptide (TPR) repeat protein
MRASTRLTLALLMLTAIAKAFAQYAEVDPRTLPAQVAAQELVVQTESRNNDPQAWLKLAVLLQDAGSYRESEDAYHHVIALLRAPDPLIVADVFDHMATMYLASGQLAKAEPVVRHALAIRENQHDQIGAGVSHMHLAMLLLDQNDLRSAEAEAQSAVSLLVPEYAHLPAASSATPEEKMAALISLALVQCAAPATPAAIPHLQWALQIAHENYPDTSLPVGHIEFLLGYAYWKSGDPKDADEWMSRGVHKLATVIGWGHPAYLRTLRQYRAFLVETKQRDKAQLILAEIERLDHSKHPPIVASGSLAPLQDFPR